MLFSEPKIPQYAQLERAEEFVESFSALQRAENSQSLTRSVCTPRWSVSVLFSEPKILNNGLRRSRIQRSRVSVLFSEPKILNRPAATASRAIAKVSVLFSEPKILNFNFVPWLCDALGRFSALQRAENSQYGAAGRTSRKYQVSVLFSEPKILNHNDPTARSVRGYAFQCSSASRKFSMFLQSCFSGRN